MCAIFNTLWIHNKLKHEGATTSKSVFEKKESHCISRLVVVLVIKFISKNRH